MAFLYPNQNEPLIAPATPVLRLPLRVGLAFAPGADEARAGEFTEAQKTALLKRVAAEFKSRPFIQSIEVLPSSYLRPGGGFENLGQVRALLGIDVMVLLSYDQVQFTDENRLSLAYWTIVGAYFFKGNKNDTHTLMEAVVYDIPSRKLLFRAPGASQIAAGSTMVEIRQQLRVDGVKGFEQATDDLTRNLKEELTAFSERVKSAPGEVQIEHKPGYAGAGVMPLWFAGALALLGLARRMRRQD